MDSSSNIMSSDSQPVENITFMDAALYKAAAEGNIEEFGRYQWLELESLQTPNGNTVLHVHLAIPELYKGLYFVHRRVRSTNFMDEILSRCPSLLEQTNAKGETPIHIAARHGHSTIVKFLIDEFVARQDPEQQEGTVDAVRIMLGKTDWESNTALHVAAKYGHVDVVEELLNFFEDPYFPCCVNTNQETLLYIEARRGDVQLLQMVLNALKETVHCGPHGRTALHAAVMAEDAEATRLILDEGKNLTKETDENGHTPLHYAAHLGHYSIVKELLKTDISAAYIVDKRLEMTPLLMEAREGHTRIIREFLSSCPDCRERVDNKGWNLLHFVAFRNCLVFRDLYNVRHGSIRNLMDAKDARGITPEQVCHAYGGIIGLPLRMYNLYLSKDKKEQIRNLSKDIVNEEVAEEPVYPIPLNFSSASFEKARDAHLVVATLIATVTFAAAITVPGGYKSEGADQGTPFLIHDAAFKAFVVAFTFSLSAVAVHFRTVLPFASNRINEHSFHLAASFLLYGIICLRDCFQHRHLCGVKTFS